MTDKKIVWRTFQKDVVYGIKLGVMESGSVQAKPELLNLLKFWFVVPEEQTVDEHTPLSGIEMQIKIADSANVKDANVFFDLVFKTLITKDHPVTVQDDKFIIDSEDTVEKVVALLSDFGLKYDLDKCAFRNVMIDYDFEEYENALDLLVGLDIDDSKPFEDNVIGIIRKHLDDLPHAEDVVEAFANHISSLDENTQFDIMEVQDFRHQPKRFVWALEKILNPVNESFTEHGYMTADDLDQKISSLGIPQEELEILGNAFVSIDRDSVKMVDLLKGETSNPEIISETTAKIIEDNLLTVMSLLLRDHGSYDADNNYTRGVKKLADTQKEAEKDDRPDLERITRSDILRVFK